MKVGLDIVEIERFQPFVGARTHSFLQKAFTKKELAYCFAYADPAVHLAGLFAAKEAVAKALGAHTVAFIELEIRHGTGGVPQVWKKNRKLRMSISITHTDTLAAAIAIG